MIIYAIVAPFVVAVICLFAVGISRAAAAAFTAKKEIGAWKALVRPRLLSAPHHGPSINALVKGSLSQGDFQHEDHHIAEFQLNQAIQRVRELRVQAPTIREYQSAIETVAKCSLAYYGKLSPLDIIREWEARTGFEGETDGLLSLREAITHPIGRVACTGFALIGLASFLWGYGGYSGRAIAFGGYLMGVQLLLWSANIVTPFIGNDAPRIRVSWQSSLDQPVLMLAFKIVVTILAICGIFLLVLIGSRWMLGSRIPLWGWSLVAVGIGMLGALYLGIEDAISEPLDKWVERIGIVLIVVAHLTLLTLCGATLRWLAS